MPLLTLFRHAPMAPQPAAARGATLALLLLLVAGAFCAPASHAVPVRYDYTGSLLAYSPGSSPQYQTYGTRVVAELTLDDAFISSSFNGRLDSTQFSARIGTDAGLTSGLQAASSLWAPNRGFKEAFLQLVDGEIVDWSFGAWRVFNSNQLYVITTGGGDETFPYPRVMFFGTASTASVGRWTAAAPPVPEPGSWALMLVGLGLVGVAARRRQVAVSHSAAP